MNMSMRNARAVRFDLPSTSTATASSSESQSQSDFLPAAGAPADAGPVESAGGVQSRYTWSESGFGDFLTAVKNRSIYSEFFLNAAKYGRSEKDRALHITTVEFNQERVGESDQGLTETKPVTGVVTEAQAVHENAEAARFREDVRLRTQDEVERDLASADGAAVDVVVPVSQLVPASESVSGARNYTYYYDRLLSRYPYVAVDGDPLLQPMLATIRWFVKNFGLYF